VFLHDDALLSSIHLSILIHASHEFIVSLFRLDFIREPFLEEDGEFVVEIICIVHISNVSYNPVSPPKRIGSEKKKEVRGRDGWIRDMQHTTIRPLYRLLPAKRTLVLPIILHHDQTSDAKHVAAPELHGPPLDFHAHGAAVVVDLGDVG
jgi:hypothetical protein